MFRCCDCDRVFNEPKIVKTSYECHYGVDGMIGGRTSCEISICPYCGADMIIEENVYNVEITNITLNKNTASKSYIVSYNIYDEDDMELTCGITTYDQSIDDINALKEYILDVEGF